MKYIGSAVLVCCGFLSFSTAGITAGSGVPEPFQRFDDSSEHTINYDDLTELLRTVVVDTGQSTRRVAQEAPDVTGSRMKTKVKKTANEGNRFYFEAFEDDEKARRFLLEIQASLEQIPTQAPLEYFSRNEQLAYWLNLYNVTVLNQIIAQYPKQNLKKVILGKKSIFAQKLLTVSGVQLSLNDIKNTILKENYNGNPMVLYGLYQGNIGGPNIRRSAYTGATVMAALQDNASEFVNSNRGTYSRDGKTFRVSSFYDRNRAFFPNFEADLSAHLLPLLDGKEKNALQTSSKMKANINDWDVTDLLGSQRRIGGSFATSRAALLDSMRSTVQDPNNPGGTLGASVGAGSSYMAAKGQHLSRLDPGLLAILTELNDKRLAETQRGSSVTIEELEDSPEEATSDGTSDEETGQ